MSLRIHPADSTKGPRLPSRLRTFTATKRGAFSGLRPSKESSMIQLTLNAKMKRQAYILHATKFLLLTSPIEAGYLILKSREAVVHPLPYALGDYSIFATVGRLSIRTRELPLHISQLPWCN